MANSETCGADANGYNVYRFTGEDQSEQDFVGSAPTFDAARRLARRGDQIQRGLDGEVENVTWKV
jgi:hypothetical protein